jgi:hypothetical protein
VVAVNVVYVYILQSTVAFIIDICIARISLELLNYELLRPTLLLFRYAPIQPIDVLNHLILASLSRTYEVLRIHLIVIESVSSGAHAVT